MHGPRSLIVNGAVVDVPAQLDPIHTPLSRFLRARGLTGTKEGCAEGDCGACTLAVASTDLDGQPTWRSVTSCIQPLASFLGREVVTAEGLADNDSVDGGLHPVQAAMVRHLGSQCGYCTPGFVTSMFEGYERAVVSVDDPAALADQLAGNLCRCTGYRPIREAMCHALSVRDAGVVDDELVSIGGSRRCGKRAHHSIASTSHVEVDLSTDTSRYVRPTSLSALLTLKHDTKGLLLAGATELGVLLRKRDARWPLLIDTAAVAELQVLARADVRADVVD
ncbi:MAG TPA: 2Fe-2S iron-sulfur cluster-binding protein, partial [Myxococcota bacterium]